MSLILNTYITYIHVTSYVCMYVCVPSYIPNHQSPCNVTRGLPDADIPSFIKLTQTDLLAYRTHTVPWQQTHIHTYMPNLHITISIVNKCNGRIASHRIIRKGGKTLNLPNLAKTDSSLCAVFRIFKFPKVVDENHLVTDSFLVSCLPT